MRRAYSVAILVTALVGAACGGSEESSPTAESAEKASPAPAAQGPAAAGSGTARDDDCVQLTQGAYAKIVALDNVFAPECPVFVADQQLQVQNLGVRDHSLTISENSDDQTPFLLDLQNIEGGTTAETPGALSDVLEPGTYEFFCKYHSGMDGVMQVVAPVGT